MAENRGCRADGGAGARLLVALLERARLIIQLLVERPLPLPHHSPSSTFAAHHKSSHLQPIRGDARLFGSGG